jgi:hypothetical protein
MGEEERDGNLNGQRVEPIDKRWRVLEISDEKASEMKERYPRSLCSS